MIEDQQGVRSVSDPLPTMLDCSDPELLSSCFRDAVLRASPDIVSVYDLQQEQTIWASRSLSEVMGYGVERVREMQAGGLTNLLDAGSAKRFTEAMRLMRDARDGEVTEIIARVRHADGSWRVMHIRSTTFRRSADGRPIQVLNVAQDVTEQTEQAAALTRAHAFQEAVIATAPDLLLILEPPTQRLVWSSRDVSELLGWSNDDVSALGADAFSRLVHPEDLGRFREAWSKVIAGSAEVVHVRYRARSTSGSWRWLQRAMTPFERTDLGAVASVLVVVRDVTAAVETEHRLAHAALHDPLTGLPNRRLVEDRLEVGLVRLSRGGSVGVLFIDLDRFKRINDVHGHPAGDAVLHEVARRIERAVRPGDTVGRMGGDEFVVIVATLPQESAPVVMDEMAARIRHDISLPIWHDGVAYQITACIGQTLAACPQDASEMLRDADSAMYQAKKRGRDSVAHFHPTLRDEAMQRGRTEEAIRHALRTAGLEVFFQPIVRLSDHSVHSLEALVRIPDTTGGYLDAQQVVDVAENTGLINQLGAVVLRAAARHARTVSSSQKMAVNLSAREVARPDLYARIRGALDEVGLPPARLILEITETVLLEAASSTLRDLECLRADGISISIDDFGTGYASLRYLTILPVDGIKIDRSFTSGLGRDAVSSSVISAVLHLAQDLGIACIVEGVETPQQLQHLRQLSDAPEVFAQGYLLGYPAP